MAAFIPEKNICPHVNRGMARSPETDFKVELGHKPRTRWTTIKARPMGLRRFMDTSRLSIQQVKQRFRELARMSVAEREAAAKQFTHAERAARRERRGRFTDTIIAAQRRRRDRIHFRVTFAYELWNPKHQQWYRKEQSREFTDLRSKLSNYLTDASFWEHYGGHYSDEELGRVNIVDRSSVIQPTEMLTENTLEP